MVLCSSCGSQTIIRTSWTSVNPGRRFYFCNRQGMSCGFRGWADAPLCQRALEVIPSLLSSINRSGQLLRNMAMESRRHQEHAKRMEMESKKHNDLAKTMAVKNKILKYILFVSWVFFILYSFFTKKN